MLDPPPDEQDGWDMIGPHEISGLAAGPLSVHNETRKSAGCSLLYQQERRPIRKHANEAVSGFRAYKAPQVRREASDEES
jgi:hypothetical protein